MLVDENNLFLSQRNDPQLALFRLEIKGDQFSISHLLHPDKKLQFAVKNYTSSIISVTIWEDTCQANIVSEEVNDWFTKILNRKVKLVYMPESTTRKVDPKYAIHESSITSFSDAYPILMISEASLQLLNSKLINPVGFDRFRPNIVITGMKPHEEDELTEFTINSQIFFGVKQCARCIMTTIDQDSGMVGKEPLRSLAVYRTKNGKILFGQNVIGPKTGNLKIGDKLEVTSRLHG